MTDLVIGVNCIRACVVSAAVYIIVICDGYRDVSGLSDTIAAKTH